MKKIIIFLLVGLLFSCGKNNSKPLVEDYEKIADEITFKTTQKLERELELSPIGSGGSMMHDIKMMSIALVANRPLEVPLARRLIVKSIEIYLEKINKSEKIRPYLHNYPFTTKDIEINIFDSNGEVLPAPYLTNVYLYKNIIYYETQYEKCQTILKETFEEAYRTVYGHEKLPMPELGQNH